MNKVFLGGTCNGSTWREELKPKLKMPYFDPVVEDWNEEAMKREEIEKNASDYHLYVITNEMKGVYSIAEVVDSAWRSSLASTHKYTISGPRHTVFCIIPDGFDESQIKSLRAVGHIVDNRGQKYFENLEDVANFLNGQYKRSK